MAAEHKAKGDELERRVGRVEFADGALVRLRWDVHGPSSSTYRTITDVDVLSIEFDGRLRSATTITECKSVRGLSGESDRLIWMAGLRQLVQASRAMLVREAVSGPGRELAARLQVDLLGETELQRRERAKPDFPALFGHLMGQVWMSTEREAAAQLKKLGHLSPRLLGTLRHASLVAEPHRAIGTVLTVAELVESGSALPRQAGTVVASQAFTTFLLASLRLGGRLDAQGADGIRREIEGGLATGDPQDQQVLRVLALADALLRDQASQLHARYVKAGARPIEAEVPSLLAEAQNRPEWLPLLFDLVERLRARPDVARHLPQLTDLVTSDALIGEHTWHDPVFDHMFTVHHRQLLLVALDVFARAAPRLADHLSPIRDLSFDRARSSSDDDILMVPAPPEPERVKRARQAIQDDQLKIV